MVYGLIGKTLKHSFSKSYFTEKFKELGLAHRYLNFELNTVGELPALIRQRAQLKGLNVTFPYKKAVIPYLHDLGEDAKAIGAVNTIKIEDGKWLGYNTDHYGFRESLSPLLEPDDQKALILGSGGAADAVLYGLSQLGIKGQIVSRRPAAGQLGYLEAGLILGDYPLLINTTPCGTYPKLTELPPLDISALSSNHLVYDLVYNPRRSALLQAAEKRGARVKNGLEMLHLQAERAWEIWNH